MLLKETKPKMEAVVEDFKRKLANVRTGRATVGLLDTSRSIITARRRR